MMQINPHIKNTLEYSRKIWDDMLIISDYTLEVDSPYPMPEKHLLAKKSARLTYKTQPIKLKHHGRNIELLIKQASTLDNQEAQEEMIINIARLMKSLSSTWNNDSTDDAKIIENIQRIAEGKLSVDFEKLKSKNLFDNFHKERSNLNKASRRTATSKRRKS